MNIKKTTNSLERVLERSGDNGLRDYMIEYEDALANETKPFAAYMRMMFQNKKLKQQDVFLAADISEGYGYKLISEEKHTVQRDVIIKICLAARFKLKETQRALQLYGMSPLYARVPRDAVFIIAFNRGIYNTAEVDDMLRQHKMETLYSCKSADEE